MSVRISRHAAWPSLSVAEETPLKMEAESLGDPKHDSRVVVQLECR